LAEAKLDQGPRRSAPDQPATSWPSMAPYGASETHTTQHNRRAPILEPIFSNFSTLRNVIYLH